MSRKIPKLFMWMATLLFFSAVVLPAFAQSSRSEVRILPMSRMGNPTEHAKPLQSRVDVVLVNVTVTDSRDRLITDLQAKDFSVLDDKHQQRIRYFSLEDAPVSIVVILDASGSMERNFEQARSAVIKFLRFSNPQDEFALVTLADTPRLLTDFTVSPDRIESLLRPLQPRGETALWDAIYFGLEQMRGARHGKKALLLISDGGDNHSRYTQSEIKSALREADVQVYAIDIFEPFPRRREEKSGLLALDEVASTTGGRVLLTHDASELHRAVLQISDELRTQYVLGYLPGPSAHDGKWHKVKVELNVPKSRKLRSYAKKGYYSSADQ